MRSQQTQIAGLIADAREYRLSLTTGEAIRQQRIEAMAARHFAHKKRLSAWAKANDRENNFRRCQASGVST